MSKVFIISDHHFGHKKVLDFESSREGDTIEEHDRILIEKHNSVIKKKDTVWFLGDVCFQGELLLEYIPQMNGTINLVLGNHDIYDLELYQSVFNKVKAIQPYKGGVLTHVPIHNGSLDRWKINYHGHLHSTPAFSEQHINCCVEHCEGFPRTLEQWQNSRR